MKPLLVLSWLIWLPLYVFAVPDLSKPLGPTIADTGSHYYHFSKHALASKDGQRHYQVVIAIPNKKPPKGGYPVLYLLDGNAALAGLNDHILGQLPKPPVIVAVGYQTPLRFDVKARTVDYTPPRLDGKVVKGRYHGGGADAFLALLNGPIKRLVVKNVAVNPKQQTLWGHSFGGLFVLYVLTQAPDSFQAYAAADPALWWQQGEMMARLRAFKGANKQAQVLVMHASAKGPSRPAGATQNKGMDEAALAAARMLAAKQKVTSHYREYPALSHGPLFNASLLPALRLAQGHLED
ncbi:alpha/beta hydrolase [Gallaecimonas mangrovi]|uniref:alpha/beta hydrolase n=1 Tax=Gallaecimonas mangrovi TaxID=2291597 RepID=UPI000E1FDB85|nr:alpha/beta hydrolase-fold protein [Gallaecimonas mangrovi]